MRTKRSTSLLDNTANYYEQHLAKLYGKSWLLNYATTPQTCHYTTFSWPPNRAGHYMLQLWFLSSFFFSSFFFAYSQRSEIGCLSYFHTWCARNLLLSLLVKELWKSLSSWQVNGKSKVASFNGHIEYIHSVFRKKNTSFVFHIIPSQVNELHKSFIIYSWKNAHYKYLKIVYLFAKYFCH